MINLFIFLKRINFMIIVYIYFKVSISVELQYFLIKEDLKLLHDSFDIRYQSIIAGNAKDALKVNKYFN
jgi:hypothetical protein